MSISCGSLHSAVLTDQNLYTFGWNNYGQLGDGAFKDKNIPTKITLSFKSQKIL